MAHTSLAKLFQRYWAAAKGRLKARTGVGRVQSQVGTQPRFLSQAMRAATFQQRSDATRQKIGVSDARLPPGAQDAREKLLQEAAWLRIKEQVWDGREMLKSYRQQSTVSQKFRPLTEALGKISWKRSSPAPFMSHTLGQ